MTQFSFIYHLYSISRHLGNRRWGYACVSVFFFMFFPFLAHQQGLERKWWKFACRSRASGGAAFGPFALEQLEDDMSNEKNPWLVGVFWGIILPSYIGITIHHYKDPY